jgi:acyl-coenzyme A synthetase/AMP-(fatty) acid ligase
LEVISPRVGTDWIRTSDLAMIDEDGFVFHRGRADGAIMRGGFKILPETIERALLSHEAVADVAATGVPDKRLGQVPAVAILLKSDVPQPTTKELEAFLRQRIEATHIPVVWRFVEKMPHNSMMKVDRRALKSLFETESADV